MSSMVELLDMPQELLNIQTIAVKPRTKCEYHVIPPPPIPGFVGMTQKIIR